MKILMVDDETKILNGMSYIFAKKLPQHEVVAIINNPLVVMNILKKQTVDIVFTDVKMPEMSGIELTKHIHESYPETRIVILSAYSDFDSVRLCMKNGAFDYLLKPVSYKAIIEITRRIEPLINRSHNDHQRQQLCTELKAVLNEECTGLPEPYNKGACRLYVFYADYYSGSDQSLLAGLNEQLDSLSDNISYPFRKGKFLMALQHSITPQTESMRLMEQCVAYFRTRGNDVYCTFYNLAPDNPKLAQAFSSCCEAIDFLVFNELRAIASPVDYREMQRALCTEPLTKQLSSKVICKLIVGGQTEELKAYLSDTTHKILSQPGNRDPQAARQQACELLFAVRKIFDVVKQLEQQSNHDYLARTMNMPTCRTLLEELCRQMLQLGFSMAHSNHPSYIHKAVDYMQQNYMNNISLKEIAELVNLNPWYLSTQFKRYLQESFSEHLTRVRIDAAKTLLQQNDLKIYEVSEMVGFQEPTYFNTVFKKLVGVSPKGYQSRFFWKE